MKIQLQKIQGILALLLLLLLSACTSPNNRQISRGFYYWKTNVSISAFEDSAMKSLHSQFLYVRFFDVDLSPDGNNIKPKAIANFSKPLPQQRIVPVVFITTRALNKMSANRISFYAANIADLLAKKCAGIGIEPNEIQIDCDWTTSNKGNYFEFLRKLKKQPFLKGKKISATIRLYQEKYAKSAGIPPVDKGLLMVYNMNKLTDFRVKNSIITKKTAKDYLDNVGSYPLPLDIALPIYSWTLLFEDAQLKGILREVKEKDLTNPVLFEKQPNNRYLVLLDTIFKGYRLKKGAVIRYENSSFETLNSVAKYLSEKMQQDTFRVLLYHCDSLNFSNYSKDELEKIFSDFN